MICALVIQPALGYLHHRHYVQYQSRGLVSHVHIWWGRVLILLGIVNGGTGLRLSMASDSLIIAYSVVAAIMFFLYAISKVLASIRKRKASRRVGKEQGQGQGQQTPSLPRRRRRGEPWV